MSALSFLEYCLLASWNERDLNDRETYATCRRSIERLRTFRKDRVNYINRWK